MLVGGRSTDLVLSRKWRLNFGKIPAEFSILERRDKRYKGGGRSSVARILSSGANEKRGTIWRGEGVRGLLKRKHFWGVTAKNMAVQASGATLTKFVCAKSPECCDGGRVSRSIFDVYAFLIYIFFFGKDWGWRL